MAAVEARPAGGSRLRTLRAILWFGGRSRSRREPKASSRIAHKEVSQEQPSLSNFQDSAWIKLASPSPHGKLRGEVAEVKHPQAAGSGSLWRKLRVAYGVCGGYAESTLDVLQEPNRSQELEETSVPLASHPEEEKTAGEEDPGTAPDVDVPPPEDVIVPIPDPSAPGPAAAYPYQELVERLRSGSLEERAAAAEEVRSLARCDGNAREAFGAVGAVFPLVLLMQQSGEEMAQQRAAVLALLNLAIGHDGNKRDIAAAEGALGRLVQLLEKGAEEVQAATAAAMLSLSALDANKAVIGSSGAIPILVRLLKGGVSAELEEAGWQRQRRRDALGALYNLSLCKGNLALMVGCGAVAALLSSAGEEEDDDEVREKAMAVLGHLVGVESGRRAIGSSKDGVRFLVELLRGEEASPKTQERAVFILMVVAHHSRTMRGTIARAGAVNALLELLLLGTPLAQKRASKLLDSLREDSERGRSISAPMATGILDPQPEIQEVQEGDESTSLRRQPDERRAMEKILQQSLQRNFRTMVRRANCPSTAELQLHTQFG